MGNGGPWTPADVNGAGTRPGFYLNFIEAAAQVVQPGDRGIVGILSEADWGPANSIVEIASLAEAAAAFTTLEDASARLYNLVRLAFLGGAHTVKAVRLMHGTGSIKALKTLVDTAGGPANVITITAKYFGTYGNSIGVTVTDDPVDATKTRVRVYVAGTLVHEITSTINHGSAGFIQNVVDKLNALDSPWITATFVAAGNADLADLTSITLLLTGSNGNAVDSTVFTTGLNLFSSHKINLLTSDTVSGAFQTVIETWIDDRRADGYRVIGVIGSDTGDSATTMVTDAQSFNNPYMVYVGPGIVMPNVAGTSSTYTGATAASMIAGIIAGVGTTRSVTYMGLPTVTGVETQLTNAQVKSMIAAGVLVIAPTPFGALPSARIERGVTSMYDASLVSDVVASYKLIRTVRIVDGISDGLAEAAERSFIGTQLNDLAGQNAVLDAVHDFLRLQEEARTITNGWKATFDPLNPNQGPNIFLAITIRPIDAIEFIFASITLDVA